MNFITALRCDGVVIVVAGAAWFLNAECASMTFCSRKFIHKPERDCARTHARKRIPMKWRIAIEERKKNGQCSVRTTRSRFIEWIWNLVCTLNGRDFFPRLWAELLHFLSALDAGNRTAHKIYIRPGLRFLSMGNEAVSKTQANTHTNTNTLTLNKAHSNAVDLWPTT